MLFSELWDLKMLHLIRHTERGANVKMFLMKPSSFDLFSIPSGLWEWKNKVIFNLNLNVLLGQGGGGSERYMELIFGDFHEHCNPKHI